MGLTVCLQVSVKQRWHTSASLIGTTSDFTQTMIQFSLYTDFWKSLINLLQTNKLHGLSPQANYIDQLSDRRLSAKLVPTLADRGCRVVSATIPPQSLISVF
jgi:hypothetical protein